MYTQTHTYIYIWKNVVHFGDYLLCLRQIHSNNDLIMWLGFQKYSPDDEVVNNNGNNIPICECVDTFYRRRVT